MVPQRSAFPILISVLTLQFFGLAQESGTGIFSRPINSRKTMKSKHLQQSFGSSNAVGSVAKDFLLMEPDVRMPLGRTPASSLAFAHSGCLPQLAAPRRGSTGPTSRQGLPKRRGRLVQHSGCLHFDPGSRRHRRERQHRRDSGRSKHFPGWPIVCQRSSVDE